MPRCVGLIVTNKDTKFIFEVVKIDSSTKEITLIGANNTGILEMINGLIIRLPLMDFYTERWVEEVEINLKLNLGETWIKTLALYGYQNTV